MRGAPDFLRPVGRLAGVVEERAHLHDHGRGLRLVDEFLLAPPAHADRLARHLHGDDGGVGRGIVGAVVAVAARALHVMHGDVRMPRCRAPWRARRATETRPGNASTPSDGRRDIRRDRRTARSRRARDSRAYRSPRSAGGLAARPARARRTRGRSKGRCSSQVASCWPRVGVSTFCQVTALTAAAPASSTAVSSSPTMARKLPVRTKSILPLAARLMAFSSILSMVAPRLGWRTTRACSMPASRMSWMKTALPKILSGKSRRALLSPMCFRSATGLRLPLPVALTARFTAPASVQ